MNKPFSGLYVKVGDVGVKETLDLCKRAQDAGYNGDLLAWDNRHARPEPSDSDKADALWLGEQLANIGARLIVQTCYTGDFVASALGDSSIMESNGEGDPQCCLADDRVFDVWRQWLLRFKEWHPSALAAMASYDEIRRGGSHPACRGKRAGDLLAAHVKRFAALVREVLPNVLPCVFNDMFDPPINAHADYHGNDFTGSWEGVDPGILIANWATTSDDEQSASFPWWQKRGNKQLLLGYYDYAHNNYQDGRTPDDEKRWIGKSIDAAPGSICGYVFTTWNQDDTAWGNIGRYYPGDDLIARMVPFPVAGPVPPQPPVPPGPPTPPDPLATTRAAIQSAQASAHTIAGYLPGIRSQAKRRAAIDESKRLDGKLLDALNSLPKP